MLKITGWNLTSKTIPIIASPSFSSTKFKNFTGIYTYTEVNGRSPSDRLSERFNSRFPTSALQLSSHVLHTNVGNKTIRQQRAFLDGWLKIMAPRAEYSRRQRGRDLEFRHLLTYSMVQSPSWEANWSAASQEIPRISRNPKVHYRTHKRPPPISILGQPNPVHIPTSHLLEIHPNIIRPSTPRSPQWSPSLRFPHQRVPSYLNVYQAIAPSAVSLY